MTRTLADLGEDGVIALFARASAAPDVVVPNGDDAAAWRVPDGEVPVITTDTLVERVHFDWSFASSREVGRKLIAVNLSDVAAMGARPRFVLISLSAPPAFDASRLGEIAAGVHARCDEDGLVILGGNTTRTDGPIVLTAVLIGSAPPARIIRRTGSRPGDRLLVTGTLGDARAALELWRTGQQVQEDLRLRLADPTPRVAAGMALAATGRVHAMCDVSDGLARDLRRLLAPDGLSAHLDRAHLPISAANPFPELAIEGGEDYELLLTAAPEDVAALAAAVAPLPLTDLGPVVAADDEALPRGFDHFADVR